MKFKDLSHDIDSCMDVWVEFYSKVYPPFFEKYFNFNALSLSITYVDYYEKGDDLDKEIIINLDKHTYECGDMFYGVPEHLTIQEHKLLNELFTIWGWI